MIYSLKERINHYRRSHPEVVDMRLTGKTPQKYRLVVTEKLNNQEKEYVLLGVNNIEEFLNASLPNPSFHGS